MARAHALGAVIGATTACSGLLGLDALDYTGDASVSDGMDSAESAVAPDGGGCDSADQGTGCTDPYCVAVMSDHPAAYFRLSDPTQPAKQRCHNEVAGSTYTCSYSTSGITYGAQGENACASAVRLDPSTGSVSFADAAGALDFPGDVPFSIEAWLEPDPVDGAVPLGSLASAMASGPGNGPYNGYSLSISGIGPGPRDEMWVGGKLAFYSQIQGLPAPSSPFHLVLVHGSDHLDHLYMNGNGTAFEGSADLVPPAMAVRPASGEALRWAGFTGTLGEVAIYETALSTAQIMAHFNAGGT